MNTAATMTICLRVCEWERAPQWGQRRTDTATCCPQVGQSINAIGVEARSPAPLEGQEMP